MDSTILQSWDHFLSRNEYSNFLQTSAWANLKAKHGWESDLLLIQEAGEIVAGASLLFKALPGNLAKLCYIPRGPVVDWYNQKLVTKTLFELDKKLKDCRTSIVIMEPEVFSDPLVINSLEAYGFVTARKNIQPPNTIQISTSNSLENILTNMKSKTRYNTKLAQKKGVRIRFRTMDDIDVFYKLIKNTSDRNQFGLHSFDYYYDLFNIYLSKKSEISKAAIIFAEKNDTVLASVFLLALGKKCWYVYGASSNEYRNTMPAYALQWEAIKWAKHQGCEIYDLWGIPDFDEDILEKEFMKQHDGLWGVYRFKRGFGGQVKRYVGTFKKSYGLIGNLIKSYF